MELVRPGVLNSLNWPSILIGALIGGMVSLAISYGFYVAASKDLKRKAAEFGKLTISLIHLLNNAGAIEVKEFDPETGVPTKWSVSSDLTLRWSTEAPPEQRALPETVEQGLSGEVVPLQEERRSWWRRWFGI